MTCTNCNCNKKKPATKIVAAEPRRYLLPTKYVRDFLVAVVSALLVWGIVTYGPAKCDCKDLEFRVSALEKHSVKVDSQFHKSLK